MAAGWISVAQCLSSVSMSSGLSSGRKEKSLCFSGRPDLRDFIRLRISPELPGPQYFSSLSHACRNAVCFELPSCPSEKPERVRCWISQVRGPSWWDCECCWFLEQRRRLVQALLSSVDNRILPLPTPPPPIMRLRLRLRRSDGFSRPYSQQLS